MDELIVVHVAIVIEVVVLEDLFHQLSQLLVTNLYCLQHQERVRVKTQELHRHDNPNLHYREDVVITLVLATQRLCVCAETVTRNQ